MHGPGQAHAPIDPEVLRSKDGFRAVVVSLIVLLITALLQVFVFVLSGSVALLADLIHNVGDALTAVPVGLAFLMRSRRAERWAGVAVVAAILVSALFAGAEAVMRLIHPDPPSHLPALAAAGFIGFAGNRIVAAIRLRAGHRLGSAALVADGEHARADAIISLGVVATAIVVAIGVPIADPIIGLVITAGILRITWQSWKIVREEFAEARAGEDAIQGSDHSAEGRTHHHDHPHAHSH